MRRLLPAILLTLVISGTAFSQPKLSPGTRLFLQNMEAAAELNTVPHGFVYKELSDGMLYLSSLVKVKDEMAAGDELRGLGARIGTKAGNIWTVQVPVTRVEELAVLKSLQYV